MVSIEEKQRLFLSKSAAMVKPVKSKTGEPVVVVAPPPPKEEPPRQPHPNDDPRIKLSAFGYRPLFSCVNIDSDKWLLTVDEESRAKLECPPSRADGIDAEMEEDLRYLGAELIQSGAILLRLPQTAAATGQILFHRFFYMKSFAKFHFEHLVMACLLLAAKIEEAPRRPRDVINVFNRLEELHKLRRKGQRITKETTARIKPKLLDANYVSQRNQVIKAERRLLSTLGFVVHVKHPHKLIFSYAHILSVINHTDMMQKAWSYMNDGLRTDMFVRYTPETIACACISLAAKTVDPKVPLPIMESGNHWFELFDASDRDIQNIQMMLIKLYQRRRAPDWSALNKRLDEIRFGKADPDEAKRKALETANKLTQLQVNGTENTSRSPSRDENRRDSGRRKASRSRSRSRSRSKDGGRGRRRDSPRRRSRSPDRRGRGNKNKAGREEWRGGRKGGKGNRDNKRVRSRDRKDRSVVGKNRERDDFQKRRKGSISPPSRYRK